MNDDFFIWVSIYILFALAVIIWLGEKRNKVVLNELKNIIDGINTVSGSVNDHEKSEVSRDYLLRSLVSKNNQKLESVINQTSNTSVDRICCLEDRIVNEILSSTSVIKSSIQHTHSGISKSFKTKLNDLHSELTEINLSISQFKEEILKTQSKSFNGIESKVVALSNEERQFIEQQIVTINNEHNSIDNSIHEVAKAVKTHMSSHEQFKELFDRMNVICEELTTLDKVILNQEKSLNGMVGKHIQIVNYTQELQKTSKDIFDLMKLMLMDSVVKKTTSKK